MSLVLSAPATPAQAAHALAAVHALLKGERHAEAAAQARRLRLQHPHQLAGYTMEARALLELGRPADALAVLRSLPAVLRPDFDHLHALGSALARLGEPAQALPALMQALSLRIGDAGTHYLLGNVFNELGLKAESAECLRTAVALGLHGSELAARGQLVFREREACRWPQAEAELALLRQRLQQLAPKQPCETSPFGHAVLVGDPAEQLRVARHHALHVARRVRPLPPRRAVARERLRVGYLSADFHNHATSQLLVHTLEHHDRARFEIHALSTGPDDGSLLRRRVLAAVEHFHELRGHDPVAIARRVRELGIDLLIDLKGATHDSLLPVLAQRPAPLQAGWLGFPGSSGAPYIDYLIGDPVVTPLEHAPHFAEAIAQLPLCYQPNDAPARAAARRGAQRIRAAGRCAAAVRVPPAVQDFGRGVRRLVRSARRAARCAAVAARLERRRVAAAARRGARARHRPGAAAFRAAPAGGAAPAPSELRGPVPRHLAVQCAHHRRRGAVGRRAGGQPEGRGLRAACRRQPAAGAGPG